MSPACPADQPAHSRVTILVVEDEILVRLVVAEELRAQGYTVVEAADADEALSILRSKVTVTLVLTDIWMPGSIDGLDLARLVRAEYPATKIVIASGHMPNAEAGEWADGFFSKPYDFPRLVADIKALLA